MRDGKPYWTGEKTNRARRDEGAPHYLEHFLLAETNHASGKWEMYCVDYKPDQLHEGGKFVEFYWDGDFQETFPFSIGTREFYKEQLDQFIEFWTDENQG